MIPFVKATESPWFMKLFTEYAKLRHVHSSWDSNTWQVYSAEEAELEDLLADDNEMNKSDGPTLKCDSSLPVVNIPNVVSLEVDPILYQDTDSVSTFNTAHPIRNQPSVKFTPKIIPTTYVTPPANNNISIDIDSEQESVSKFSDMESRLSSIEDKFEAFQSSLLEIKTQPSLEAKKKPHSW